MAYPPATWRLILEPQPRPGMLNLAIDEAILRAVAEGKAPPTLRLYGWSPPALTLGRGQPYADADVRALQRDGIALLRRMTGGTAVLNREELTYAVAARHDDPRLSGSIAESYRGISEGLVRALHGLGVTEADASGREPGERPSRAARTPVCFELPSDYEVTVEGRKVVGNSQMRVRGGIFQHGSLPLTGDMGDIGRYLTSHPSPARVRAVAMTLQEALGRTATWEEVADAVVAAFRVTLNLTLVPSPLTTGERQRVEALVGEKYGSEAWTRRL
ncbi:MAG: lipoate--protein ligase family protein [Anaerolineae bacterium]|nr:lipoate--protein ligase family protein [Anaerolineae bacterium]